MAWLAIDQGTSSTKAVVLDDAGAVLALAERPVTVDARAGGAVETDPDALWGSVVDAGRSALADASSPALDAVSLSNQGETVLAWDRDSGRPLTPAIVWQDRRALAVCDARRDHSAELRRITGLELDPYFVAPKLRWLRDHCGGEGVVGTTDTWLLQRLCGAFVTDIATASRSLLLDLDEVRWSERCIDVFGLGAETLATVVPNDATLGETSAFGSAAAVRGICVDQQAALFAEGCWEHGDTKCTYGTGAFLLTNTGPTPVRSRSGLVGCVAWQTETVGTRYCLDGQVYTVGAAASWLESIGLIDGPDDLDRLGGAVDDCDGATFVPGLAGLAAPFWAPDARGAFVGLSLSTSRSHLVRSVLEGIAAQVAWLARGAAEDLGAPLARLRVDGGATRSVVLMQLQADLAQIPVELYPSAHATALGVAQLGGAPAAPWTPDAVYEPRITADAAETRLEAWRAAADATLSR